MTAVARAVSLLFHPLFLPTYGLYLIFNGDSYLNYMTPEESKRALYTYFFLNTVVMPGLSIWVMKYSKMISSFQLENRKERTVPFIVTLFYFGLTYFLIKSIPLPPALFAMHTGVMLTVALAILINFKWKISIHMLGIGGLLGGILALSINLQYNAMGQICLILLVAGLVGSSRLWLKAHHPAQVYVGALVGFLIQFELVRMEVYF